MKQKLLKHLLLLVLSGSCSVMFSGGLSAQNCIPTNINGRVINMVCPQTCSDFIFQIPHIKSSSDYRVNSIPYTPYPYVTAGGVELSSVYIDDFFSPVIAMPFTFCFYGAQYNNCVVGSNGIITFDPTNANTINAWSLTTIPNGTVPQPIPYSGGIQDDNQVTYYPRASIMGAYHDIYPLIPGPGQRRVEYSIVGTAPCRKFIVSYFQVPMYGSGPCNAMLCTEQMVLHESTGIIDVYLGEKPTCVSWNQGLAILGLQNWNQNAAVWAPGKIATVWSESQTGYSFIPSGPGSRYVSAAMYTLGGALVATADTITTTAGLLDLRFLNFCPPSGSNQYEIRTTFSSCSDPATQLVSLDTITINRTNDLYATAATTNSSCGPPSGSIIVTVPAGAGTAPFTYELDGGAPVIGPATYTYSNVLHGPHTIVVTDANGSCTSTINVTVNRNNGIIASATSTPSACAGVATGTITITTTNGVGPYSYSLNAGMFATGPSPYTYTGLSGGTYSLVITDATGCLSNPIIINVANNPGVNGNYVTTATTCATAANGSITFTVSSGVAPFTVQLDGGTVMNGTGPFVFNNVAAGAHSISVVDAVGCSNIFSNIMVSPGPALIANNTATATTCNGASNGTISVMPSNGAAPYTFSLDGAAPVSGMPPYMFTNVNAGLHTIQVFDAVGCSSVIYNVTVDPGPSLTTTLSKTDVLCNGDATGIITINQPPLGMSPFEYSIDGTNWQTSNVFSGLLAGNYTAFYRSFNSCMGSSPITIAEPLALSASSSTVPVVCNGENNGIITMAASGGVSPYQYSIDGGTSWQSSTLFNVTAGSHTITIRDANNCITTRVIAVTEPAALTAFSTNSNATCDGGDDGRVVVNASGGNSGYQYSLNGGSFQSLNNFSVAPGNYTISVKDNLGCTTSFVTTVGLTVNLFLTPQNDITICQGLSGQLNPQTNATVYAWSPATTLSNAAIRNPIANPVGTTEYVLAATLGRCTTTDTIIVNVNVAPIPNAGNDVEICYGQSHTLQGSGGVQYTWTPGIYLSSNSGANPVSTPTLTTTYTLSVRDGNGCQSLITDNIRVDVKRVMSVATFPFDTIASPGEQIQLLATSQGITYSWKPTTGLSNPFIPNPVVTVGAAGDEIMYEVAAINADGCKGEGYVRIKVYKGPTIYVPTAFTPNGDGKNDRFTPIPVGIKNYNYFRVFNRWGQLLFSTTRLHEGWDGKILGREQASGVYIWMIEGVGNDNKVITKKGTMTLIR